MPDFKDLIQQFDRMLQQHNPINYNKLLSPLPETRIDEILYQLGVTHPDLKELFAWKDGVDLSKGLGKQDNIFGYGVLFNLTAIWEIQSEFPQQNRNLIKFIGDFSGDALLFNNDKASTDYGKIFIYSVALFSIDDPYSYYDSLSSLLSTVINAYQLGIFKYDDNKGRLVRDYTKFRELAKGLNPQSNFWCKN